MGQQLLNEQGILPQDFYSTSLDDFAKVQAAKSRKDRLVDPLALMRSVQN